MANDPRTPLETPRGPASRLRALPASRRALVVAPPAASLDADLALLLAERDREDPFLTRAPREGAPTGEDAIDEQILAGLVTP